MMNESVCETAVNRMNESHHIYCFFGFDRLARMEILILARIPLVGKPNVSRNTPANKSPT